MAVRGSSWDTRDRADLASASRFAGAPKSWRHNFIGFRCALIRFKDSPNLLDGTITADWHDAFGTWKVTPERIAQTDGTPLVDPLVDRWLLWKKPSLPHDWLLEFRAEPDPPDGQYWEVNYKVLRIAYRFVSPADYSAVIIGHGGVQIVRQEANVPSRFLARLPGEADPDMAKNPVPYAVEVCGNWVRVFRRGVLMVEALDQQHGIGSIAFEWVNVPGSLYDVRLRAR
jgi:hypothetical protein